MTRRSTRLSFSLAAVQIVSNEGSKSWSAFPYTGSRISETERAMPQQHSNGALGVQYWFGVFLLLCWIILFLYFIFLGQPCSRQAYEDREKSIPKDGGYFRDDQFKKAWTKWHSSSLSDSSLGDCLIGHNQRDFGDRECQFSTSSASGDVAF